MADEQARDLRQRGILAAKAGDKEEARRLLQQSIRLEPGSEPAWLWLASVSRDPQERLFCIQKLLEVNPRNELGLKALESMQGAQPSGPSIRSIPGVTIAPPAPEDEPTVPLPSAERIAEAQRQADVVVRTYLNAPVSPIRWTAKTRNRAGERDSAILRTQIAVAVVVFLAVAGVLGTTFVLNNSAARAILFAPTWTMTHTPTTTSTPTPGLTPTPSATSALTLTPSPTVPPSITPWNAYFLPRATEAYPRVESAQLEHALALVDAGRLGEALPTLQAERLAVNTLFRPAPFYYQAIAQAKAGRGDAALQTLQDAEAELNPSNTAGYKPVIDAGYAIVYSLLGQQALADGDAAQSRDAFTNAQARALAALESDPRNAQTYVALARSLRLGGSYGDALAALDDGLALPELATDLHLIVEKGEVYFDQGAYDDAEQQAYFALYVDAANEPAHLLRIRAALAQDRPGLAVIYTQNYLFYYPGSALGYKLLGDARVQEGNPGLALAAYTQALQAPASDITVPALLARAALYEDERRYDLARADYGKAFDLGGDLAVRARRMMAAYNAGKPQQALEDADALLGREVVPDPEINLLKARILIDGAEEGDDSVYREAAGLLAVTTGFSPEDLATAHYYLARAQHALGDDADALKSVDAALVSGDTGSLHYLRGQILEARRDRNGAAAEYQWVLAWSEFYPFSFRVDAENRLEALQ